MQESALVQVLTFDFHNTLANCDPWFDLEVRDLPWAVLQHLDLTSESADQALVEQEYRALRLEVIASGNEIDAYESVARIFATIGVDAEPAHITEAVDALMRDCLAHAQAVPGAVDTVRHLHRYGVRLGVVSSAVHHQTLNWILEQLDIADCFEMVVTSASSGYYKSTPAIYDHALVALDGDASVSVHVGDSLKWDIHTAQRAGMATVWLNTPRREVFATPSNDTVPTLTLQTMENAGPLLIELLDRVREPLDV